MVGQQNKPQLLKGLEIGDREGTNLDSMQPKAALRNGQPAPAQARSGWIMRFVFRTAGPSSQLIWTAVIDATSPVGVIERMAAGIEETKTSAPRESLSRGI